MKKIVSICLVSIFLIVACTNSVSASENQTLEQVNLENNSAVSDIDINTEKKEEVSLKKSQTMKEISNSQSSEISTQSAPMYFTYQSIREAGYRVRNYVENNGRLPNYVTMATQLGDLNIPMPDFLFLMAGTVLYQYEGCGTSVRAYFNNHNPTNAAGVSINADVTKYQYYQIATNVYWHMGISGTTPGYVSTSYGNMQYQTIIYMFSRIMYWMHTNNAAYTTAGLPNYVTINVPSTHSMNKYMPTAPSIILP